MKEDALLHVKKSLVCSTIFIFTFTCFSFRVCSFFDLLEFVLYGKLPKSLLQKSLFRSTWIVNKISRFFCDFLTIHFFDPTKLYAWMFFCMGPNVRNFMIIHKRNAIFNETLTHIKNSKAISLMVESNSYASEFFGGFF